MDGSESDLLFLRLAVAKTPPVQELESKSYFLNCS
jgi:hypothetical protein